MASRPFSRSKTSRFKIAVDENAPTSRIKPAADVAVAPRSTVARLAAKAAATTVSSAARSALGEIRNASKKDRNPTFSKLKDDGKTTVAASAGVKRQRSNSLAASTARPQRVPVPPGAGAGPTTKPRPASTTAAVLSRPTTSTTTGTRISRVIENLNSQKTRLSSVQPVAAPVSVRVATTEPAVEPKATVASTLSRPSSSSSGRVLVVPPSEVENDDDTAEMDVTDNEPMVAERCVPVVREPSPELSDEEEPASAAVRAKVAVSVVPSSDDQTPPESPLDGNWLYTPPSRLAQYKAELSRVKNTFVGDDDGEMDEPTMVWEYAEEIFEYMATLEGQTMPSPNYIDGQSEITWDMRATLIDWLLQVHLRYHLLPETLWIAINIVDRFLSKRVVSLVKLQLVGVTAMFIAAKYEEIIAPGVEEFVFMTEGGYNKEDILKGERIMLQTLDFRISAYCSPYSWCRKISKADEYDVQTRTLSKFLMEVTLLDHRFLRAKPSLIAAVGMYTARTMLGGDWNDAFIYYSDYVEGQLETAFDFIVEKLASPDFKTQYVYRKYANKKFLKAAVFACEWAKRHVKSRR